MQPVPLLDFVSVPWVLVGGLAIRAYMPERTTLDVDILISAADEYLARQSFQAAGYQIDGSLAIGRFTAHRGDEPSVDVLAGRETWVRTALQNPSHDAAGYPVLGRPYLMLMKLKAARLQDVTDVQRMLRDTPAEERRSTRTLVERYAPDMVEDYDQLVLIADIEFGT